MKPIKLEITGLNSYIEKQVIDFEKLTDRGLFGIFGNTGSGKSTILDAITIAMYGNISRNTKEYINSSCDKAVISYTFEIGSINARRRYSVDRTISRNKSDKKGIKTTHARLIEVYNDGKENVLADKVGEVNKNISEIVGLTADDFTRSVVLPQGKFNEFLKLTGSDRRDMLERIFNLEKYGRSLIEKVRIRKNKQSRLLRDVEIRLSQYDGVTEELYEQSIKELDEIKLLEQENNICLENLQSKYEETKKTHENQLLLEKYEDRKKILDSRKEDIKNKSIQLENANNADKINPYIDNIQKLEKSIKDDTYRIESAEKRIEILKQELIIIDKKYEESYKLKEEKKPKLEEEKNKFKIAIELEKELEVLIIELSKLKDKGSKLNIEKEESTKLLKELESSKINILKNMKELETCISNIKISADLKQNIFKAYDLEKQYEKLSYELDKKIEKLKSFTSTLDEAKLKSKYIQRDKELILKKYSDLEDSYNNINNKCPGNNKDILFKSEQLNDLKTKLNTVKDLELKQSKLKTELNDILENKHFIGREVSVLNSNADNIEKEVIDLEKEVETTKYLNLANELRKDLKEGCKCPVCGSRDHKNIEYTNHEDKLNYLKSKLDNGRQKYQDIKSKIDEMNSKISNCTSIETLKTKELDEIKSLIGESKSSEIKKYVDDNTKLLDILKLNVDNWEKSKLELEEKLSKQREYKNNIEKEEVQNNHIIDTVKISVKELNNEYEELNKLFGEVKNEYIFVKSKTKINNLLEKVNEINENEKSLESLENKYHIISKSKNDIDEQISKRQESIHNIELSLIEEREKYSQIKKSKDSKSEELISITKGKQALSLLEDIEIQINKIVSDEESIRNKREHEKLQLEKVLEEKHKIDGSLKVSSEQMNHQSKSLNQLLIDNKFDNIYSVKRALLDKDYMRKINDEIAEYDEETKIINVGLMDLKDKLEGKRVTKEEFDTLSKSIYDTKVKITSLLEQKGSKQTIIDNLKLSLENIKDITKEKKDLESKLSLLEELDKTVQGNKFVEYVATNQLKYIALEASNRLNIITKGRYALEIDSTLNFVMRDNFNGGERRSVDTLSGGETFLTSLSLALALSSQIQLKGSAPLEFFFLDEGFGSLDSDLLEIVIESLERLHSDKLSVGIITHVEELKSRVPVKLIVKPSSIEKGSVVNIEYS